MQGPVRKPLRLPQFDYGRFGRYFVTICTRERRKLLSEIRRGDPCGRPQVELSVYGRLAESCFSRVEALYPVRFEKWVLMPNHVHVLLQLEPERATARVAPTLGRVVGAYKSLAANACRTAGLSGGLWQRGYHDHVIRGEADYREIWSYIDTNPDKWAEDPYRDKDP